MTATRRTPPDLASPTPAALRKSGKTPAGARKPRAKATKPAKPEPKFVFIDIETTGLDAMNDVILEVGLAVTDIDLNILSYGSWVCDLALAPPFDEWSEHVQAMHTKNGLYEACRLEGKFVSEVENAALAFLNKNSLAGGKFELCGSSVHFDRRFLQFHMPTLEAEFHYRNLDVSTLKVMVSKWTPEKAAPYIKNEDKLHRTLSDINATIEELRHYRKVLGLMLDPAIKGDLPF